MTEDTLQGIVASTFEEMAFLDVQAGPPRNESPETGGPVLYLEYQRPVSGAFSLWMCKSIKFQVAEAIYGEEFPSLNSEQLDDSLLELLNVLAGRLLTERFGPKTAYAMGLPHVLYEEPEAGTWTPEHHLFHSDDFPMTLTWYEARP